MSNWIATARLYLSEAGLVVDEGEPGRKTLLCAVGTEVTEATCRRYGLGPFAGEVLTAESPDADGEAPAVEPKAPSLNSGSDTENGEDGVIPDYASAAEGETPVAEHRHRYRKTDNRCKICGKANPRA